MKSIIKIILLSLAVTACSTPKEKYEKKQAEAREEYDDSLKQAQEEYREDQKDEAIDMVEDSEGVKINDDQIKVEE